MSRKGFGGLLSESQWNRLVRAGSRRDFANGKKIMEQDDVDCTVHLLIEGTVAITVGRAGGARSLIGVRGPGEPLGELSVFSGLPRTATVAACGACVTRVIKGESFRALVKDMALERMVWQHIVRRQQESEALQAELVALTPRRRLALVLLRLSFPGSGSDGPARVLTVPKKELVGPVGRSRSWIQEEFRRLRGAGIITTDHLRVYIHDADRLRQLAEAREGEIRE